MRLFLGIHTSSSFSDMAQEADADEYMKDVDNTDIAPYAPLESEVQRCTAAINRLLSLNRWGSIRLAPLTEDQEVIKALAMKLEDRNFFFQAVFRWEEVGSFRGETQRVLVCSSWNVHHFDCTCKGTFCIMHAANSMVQHSDRVIVGSTVPPPGTPWSDPAYDAIRARRNEIDRLAADTPSGRAVLAAMAAERAAADAKVSEAATPARRAPPQAQFLTSVDAAARANRDAAFKEMMAAATVPKEHPAKGYMDDISGTSTKRKLMGDATQVYLDIIFGKNGRPNSETPYRVAPLTNSSSDTELAILVNMLENHAKLYLQVIAKWDNPDSRSRVLVPISWNVHRKECRCLGSSCVAGVVAGMSRSLKNVNRVVLGSQVPPVELSSSAEDRQTEQLLRKGLQRVY